MKLTDDQIDKLFQEGAAKQNFAYKPEYWEEFSASLSDSAPLSEASDDTLDAAFQEEASNQSFEYKPEYWEEFAATLPDNTPLSQTTDDALDAAFQKDASKISVDYNPEFWNEFSDGLPLMVATEDVTDTEVDALYREEAAKLSFVYHPSYWEEMAAMLRRRRRRPEFLWFGMSGIFATAIIAMFFVQQSPVELWTPEFSWNGIEGEAFDTPANQNTVASNQTSGTLTENDISNNQNDIAQSAVTVQGSNGVNTNNTPNSATNATQNTNGNDLATTNRRNRITPNLVITTAYTTANENTSERNVNAESEGNNVVLTPMDSRTPGALTAINPTLEDAFSELPRLRPYKGGWQSSIYVQGIGGISESLITPSESIASSYGIGAGFTVGKGNWTANLGGNVLVENFSDLHLTRVGKQYVDFSSQTSREDYEFKNFYTVEMDLGLAYNFGRHQLRAGVRPSYTYNARVDYSETSVFNDQGEIIETNESRKGEFGYLGALQLWGIKPTLGYAYNFPSNWTLGVNFGAELHPSINETFISGVNRSLPIDGQLYLRKTLKFTK